MIIKKQSEFDAAGLGSPLVDFIVNCDDALLQELGLKKGTMQLIDAVESKKILERLSSFSIESAPGGSAANTIAGIAVCGGTGAFMGKVGTDEYAEYYKTETELHGIKTFFAHDTALTGHAITFITSDGERTFATHLGSAINLTKADVNLDAITASKILHIEGYLLEAPALKEACIFAMEAAQKAGTLVSVDLADPSLIERNLDSFRELVKKYADIVFVNEDEAYAFTGMHEHKALSEIAQMCSVAVVKLGARGSLIKSDGIVYEIPPYPVTVVNTNGAGDMYAAGVLFGIAHDLPLDKAGAIASFASSSVVGQSGARLTEKINIADIT